MKSSFQDYFRKLLGDEEAEQFFCAIKEKKPRRSLRVNTLKTSKESLKDRLESQGYKVSKNPFSKDGLDLEGHGQEWALKLPYHAGFSYPQDSASMFAVELLDPQPHETILDLTAAPGGKCTHIAQRMKNTGMLMANDLDRRRLKALHSNCERLGVWNTVVTSYAPHKLAELYPECFDRVLLDPSCSGEGLFVTPDGKPSFWSEKSLKRYAAEQWGLLISAFKLLKPGGRLVYSTCALNLIENEGVVSRLLEKFPEARALAPGRRFWPQTTKTKGFFCIALTKTSPLTFENKKIVQKQWLKVLQENQVKPYKEFLKTTFNYALPPAAFTLRDEHLFMVSEELTKFPLPPFYSLSFPLLKIYEHGYRPTHAGALLMGLSAKRQVYELNREEMEQVFKRQTLPNPKEKRGLYLARYQEFPLGVCTFMERGAQVVFPRHY